MKVKQGDTVMENCNECRCEASSSSPGCMEVSTEVSGGQQVTTRCRCCAPPPSACWTPPRCGGWGRGWGRGSALTSPNTSSLWGRSLGETATGLLGTAEPGAMVLAPVQV